MSSSQSLMSFRAYEGSERMMRRPIHSSKKISATRYARRMYGSFCSNQLRIFGEV